MNSIELLRGMALLAKPTVRSFEYYPGRVSQAFNDVAVVAALDHRTVHVISSAMFCVALQAGRLCLVIRCRIAGDRGRHYSQEQKTRDLSSESHLIFPLTVLTGIFPGLRLHGPVLPD